MKLQTEQVGEMLADSDRRVFCWRRADWKTGTGLDAETIERWKNYLEQPSKGLSFPEDLVRSYRTRRQKRSRSGPVSKDSILTDYRRKKTGRQEEPDHAGIEP